MTGKGRFALQAAAGLLSTLVSGVIPTVAASAGPPPGAPIPAFAALDLVVEHMALQTGNVSASIAVARDGRLVHVAAFVRADPSSAALATPATRYRVASISKTFTALAVWRLAGDKRLDLDAPVLPLLTRRLPKFSVQDSRVATITARELLVQSSGLPTAWGMYFATTSAARSCPEAATRALSGHLVDDPGASYRYSNTNYCILGLLIEAVTGRRSTPS
jgi:CubicO group peptidase (beta-lactamase class C family)